MLHAAMRPSRSMKFVEGIAVWPVSAEVGGHAIEAAELTALEVEQHGAIDPVRRGAAGRIVGS